ncbi:hypothetical protein HPB48_011860 [Haemaphysalis longicornis]|uniref:AP5B1 C-terminal domain-containing protein n=1 Tax=Haemaphysalis longicornis TaxID=44386 RepID=A0A9J6FME6_HAELO|nr:hypothetical protein HPB48_011860 [Haemaphysalis longicornis]
MCHFKKTGAEFSSLISAHVPASFLMSGETCFEEAYSAGVLKLGMLETAGSLQKYCFVCQAVVKSHCKVMYRGCQSTPWPAVSFGPCSSPSPCERSVCACRLSGSGHQSSLRLGPPGPQLWRQLCEGLAPYVVRWQPRGLRAAFVLPPRSPVLVAVAARGPHLVASLRLQDWQLLPPVHAFLRTLVSGREGS